MRSLVALMLALVCVFPVFAQAPTAPPAIPTLDTGDKILVSAVLALGQSANAECQALETAKRYAAQKAQADQLFATKYKGFVLNWQTQQLAAPKPAK